MELNPQYYMVSTDFKNAFNELIRKRAIQTCVKNFSVSANYLKTFYIPKNDLYYADNDKFVVEFSKSEEGCQQGCGLGTFLYSAGTFPFLTFILEEGPSYGLFVQPNKMEVLISECPNEKKLYLRNKTYMPVLNIDEQSADQTLKISGPDEDVLASATALKFGATASKFPLTRTLL
jgi:hypothetical protein